jgi:queuine tRNA-ribosyltransferase
MHVRGMEIETPIFMPVATQGTVKNQPWKSVRDSGAKVLLANTYHLLQRPGPEVLEKMGGIQKFMNWEGAVLSDSGGFQIFSLPGHRTLDENGATFISEWDGKKVLLSPEKSVLTQASIGSDIRMVLDVCVPSTCSHGEAASAMERTHRWARRSLEQHLLLKRENPNSKAALFGIVQGACFEDLRRLSAETLSDLPFDGFAIGGLAVGESKEERERFTEFTSPFLPKQKPRYLMGVGTPIDLLEAVHRGVDLFDCILPASLAQQGVAFTSRGRVDLRRGVYRLSEDRLDQECDCLACTHHSRSYLHHLTKAGEPLLWQLIGEHNLKYYQKLMSRIREAIREDRFSEFYQSEREIISQRDLDHPIQTSKRRPPKERVKALGDFEVVLSEKGYASIKQSSSGETMHSVSSPIEEANRLYIDQSDLKKRLQFSEKKEPLVVWDVGMGAGANAMAAIHTAEKISSQTQRPLCLVSFERDLDPIKLAVLWKEYFPYLKHRAPLGIIARSEWKSQELPIQWKLLKGDFLELIGEAPKPDLIFYDPFSFKTDAPLWNAEVFKKLCFEGLDLELFTYSSSSLVRARMIEAGFFVARGLSTGPKFETTIAASPEAYTRKKDERHWLREEWLGRWLKSQVRIPGSEQDLKVQAHPQFSR